MKLIILIFLLLLNLKNLKEKLLLIKLKILLLEKILFLYKILKLKNFLSNIKYKVNKNPNVLDKPKKYTGRNLSEMYFDFTNKEEY